MYTGKGASYLEHYHAMNPDNVWENWEFSKELTDSVQLNPYMHVYYKRVIRHNYGRLSGGIPSIVDCSRFIVTNRGGVLPALTLPVVPPLLKGLTPRFAGEKGLWVISPVRNLTAHGWHFRLGEVRRANATRWPRRAAWAPMAMDKCVLPVPGTSPTR